MPPKSRKFRPVFDEARRNWPNLAGQAVDWRPTAWPLHLVMPSGCAPLDRSAPAHQPDHEQDERDDEQHVDEVAERVATDQPEEPQHKQDHRDGKKHLSLLAPCSSTGHAAPKSRAASTVSLGSVCLWVAA